MTGSESKQGENGAQSSWGFRLGLGPNELFVTRDPRAFSARQRLQRTVAVFSSAVLTCGLYNYVSGSLQRALPANGPLDVIHVAFSLMWPCLPLLSVLNLVYPPYSELRCTESSVQTVSMLLRAIRRVRVFAAADVKRLQFIPDQFPLLGRGGRLGFIAGGKLVTCLPGLGCVEAYEVLDELQRRGFDVLNDPGLTSKVQVERARRELHP